MIILLSVPSGFHARELLLPLKSLLENDSEISKVICLTPAASYRTEIFSTYGPKFEFILNPEGQKAHDELLTRLRPDIIITTTSGLDALDVPILQAAKNNDIPTLTFIASWDNVWKMERLHHQKRPQVLADQLIVWNTMMRDHLLRVFPHLKDEQIAVIGAPRFDFFYHQDKIPSEEALRRYLSMPAGGKLIHFATTELYAMGYIIGTISEAARNKSLPAPLHLYASVHPGGNMARHQQDAKGYDLTIRYSFGRHDTAPHPLFRYHPALEDVYMLVALFKYSHLLINHSSTVAIESFLADVPVINVKYGQPLDWWRWYRSMVYRDFQQHYRDITAHHGTTVVYNRRQLIAATKRYLEQPETDRPARQLTLKKMITTTDGTASQQVLAAIKRLAKR